MSVPLNDPSRAINVVVTYDFSDSELADFHAVSPRLKVERFTGVVPDKVWAEAEILYTIKTFPLPEQAPRLRWIQLHSAGADHAVKEPIFKAHDVEVTTTSGIHSVIISEYCLMMMTAFNFQLLQVLKDQAAAEWPAKRGDPSLSPAPTIAPYPLRDQTVGIVGYGSIGRELARLCDALGMTVLAAKHDVMHPEEKLAYRQEGTGDPSGEIPRRIYPMQAVASMAKECDYLVVLTPLTPQTYHLINETVLAAMKKSAVLINVSRGDVVDEAALISALAAERIRGAGLDVFSEEPLPKSSPLWNLDNVILTPHRAGVTANYDTRAANVFIENLHRYVENRPLLNTFNRERGY